MSSSASGRRQLRATTRRPIASRCAAARLSAVRPATEDGRGTGRPPGLRGGFGRGVAGAAAAATTATLLLGGLVAALLALDAGGLAFELAQIVEARPPDLATGDDLDLLDARRVQREDALDADAVGDLADRERGARPAAMLADHDALEDLHALLVAFLDQRVNADAVSGAEIGQIGAPILALDLGQKRVLAHRKVRIPRRPEDGSQVRPVSSSPDSSSFCSSSVSGWAARRSGRSARVRRTEARRRQRSMALWSPESRTGGTPRP